MVELASNDDSIQNFQLTNFSFVNVVRSELKFTLQKE